MILPLVYYGDPRLRNRCETIKEITDEVKQLVNDMIETMDANNGVGIAAIQIGRLLRLFIIRAVLEDENSKAYLSEPEVFINPKIRAPSNETDISPEGCLSIPGVHMDVERPKTISIEALDLNGNKISTKVVGFKAREMMHENDHLNGVLFIDRVPAQKRKEVEPLLKEIKEKYS